MEFVAGLVLGFILNIVASWLYDWLKTRSLESKQHKFIEKLDDSLTHYADIPPVDEVEVDERRKDVKSKVRQLSEEIFGKASPPFKSPRQETTKYPPIDCKWCYRTHEAHDGSRGACKTCKLPLDIWIGCQGENRNQAAESKGTSP
jgi:hypothetical protein